MPVLKDLECHVQWAETDSPFPEYGTQYGDGVVETYIAIPSHPQAFTIRLTSRKFIHTGLAMIVFIDGNYQCNRNRVNLRARAKDTPKNRQDIDFLVRQKEKPMGDGTYLGREWRFDDVNIVSELPADIDHKHFDELGTIEVLVLRCHGRTPSESELSSSSSGEHSSILGANEAAGVAAADSNKISTDERYTKTDEEKPGPFEDDAGGLFPSLFDGAADYPPVDAGSQGCQPFHPAALEQHWHPPAYSMPLGSYACCNHPPGHYHVPMQSYGAPQPSPDRSHSDFDRQKPERHVHFDYGDGRGPPPGQYQDPIDAASYSHSQSHRPSHYRRVDDNWRWARATGQPSMSPQHGGATPWARDLPSSHSHHHRGYSHNPDPHSTTWKHPSGLPAESLPNVGLAPGSHPHAGPAGFPHSSAFYPPVNLSGRKGPHKPLHSVTAPVAGLPAALPHHIPVWIPAPQPIPLPVQFPGPVPVYPPMYHGPSCQNHVSVGYSYPPATQAAPSVVPDPTQQPVTSGEHQAAWGAEPPAGNVPTSPPQIPGNNGAEAASAYNAAENRWPNHSGGWNAPNANDASQGHPATGGEAQDWSSGANVGNWNTAADTNNQGKWNSTGNDNDHNQADQTQTGNGTHASWAQNNDNWPNPDSEVANDGNQAKDSWGNGQNDPVPDGWGSGQNNNTSEAALNDQRGQRALYGPHGAYYTSKSWADNPVPHDAEEEPRYDVPQAVVHAKGTSKQVQPGKGYLYNKKKCVPTYVDSFDEPHARFVFKYRTKEQLKNEIGVDIGADPTADQETNVLETLGKAELIQMVIRAKTALGGTIPAGPAKKTPPGSAATMEQVPINPPDLGFLRYNIPPVRQTIQNPGLGISLSTDSKNSNAGGPTDWGAGAVNWNSSGDNQPHPTNGATQGWDGQQEKRSYDSNNPSRAQDEAKHSTTSLSQRHVSVPSQGAANQHLVQPPGITSTAPAAGGATPLDLAALQRDLHERHMKLFGKPAPGPTLEEREMEKLFERHFPTSPRPDTPDPALAKPPSPIVEGKWTSEMHHQDSGVEFSDQSANPRGGW